MLPQTTTGYRLTDLDYSELVSQALEVRRPLVPMVLVLSPSQSSSRPRINLLR